MKNLSQANYSSALQAVRNLKEKYGDTWNAIDPESAARMVTQNRFKTGLDIANYTAAIMRKDMAEYDADSSQYTQSLGCWHGFVAQQKMIAVKKHHKTTNKKYLYLSGWMVAALRSEFGPLPDQSMHEKTAVPALIKEIYDFLRQADAIELNDLFNRLENGEDVQDQIDNFETHIVPIIADIDAGFGNEEATYLLSKKMIEAGACAIQIENQVSDAKQCGHQDGKVTVPHEDFIAKLNAIRYAFLELGVDEGIIVARTDSEGAGLTQKLPVSQEPGDLASKYLAFVETEEIAINDAKEDDVLLKRDGKLVRPVRLANGLYKFKNGSNIDRVVLDCITSLQNGADLLWIETPTPNVKQIAHMVNRIKDVMPNAKLVYNNSPSFNWTLNFRNQVFEEMLLEGENMTAYDRNNLKEANGRISFYLAREVIEKQIGKNPKKVYCKKYRNQTDCAPIMITPFVSDFQVVFKDVNGKELNDVCFNCSSQTAKDNQKEVHTAEIYLTVRSANQIYSADKKVIITNHDPGKKGLQQTITDRHHRETFFASAYLRNIVLN